MILVASNTDVFLPIRWLTSQRIQVVKIL